MSHSMGSARGQTIRCCGISMCRNRVAAGAVANPRSRWSTSTLRLLPSRRWLSSSPKTLTLPRVFGDAQGSDISLGHRFDIIPKAAESDGPSAPELQGGSGQLLELLETLAFGGGGNKKLPTQGDAVVAGVEQDTVAVLEPPVQGKGGSELDYLQVLP